jgi:GNAT superfamily N-acetyltransferase
MFSWVGGEDPFAGRRLWPAVAGHDRPGWRPPAWPHPHCPAGEHPADQMTIEPELTLRTPLVRCPGCYAVCARSNAWVPVLVDPHRQRAEPVADTICLTAAAGPRPAAAGRIALCADRRPVGHVDVAFCAACRRAVIETVHVDEAMRRHGIGRVLVAAAWARAPGYSWSTAHPDPADDGTARAFWAGLNWSGAGAPQRCHCMHLAAAAEQRAAQQSWPRPPRTAAAAPAVGAADYARRR